MPAGIVGKLHTVFNGGCTGEPARLSSCKDDGNIAWHSCYPSGMQYDTETLLPPTMWGAIFL